jgi:hypothetical protein
MPKDGDWLLEGGRYLSAISPGSAPSRGSASCLRQDAEPRVGKVFRVRAYETKNSLELRDAFPSI